MNLENTMKEYESCVEKVNLLQAEQALVTQKALQTVKEELATLQNLIENAMNDVNKIKNDLETLVLAAATTFHGSKWMVKWNKGRESWDTSKLAGFALAHPELLVLKKVGDPTVSFCKITKKEE